METWWLSFCNDDNPVGAKFLGVIIVEANGFLDAVIKTHLLGINPGGQVAGTIIPRPDANFFNRLITEDEARGTFGGKSLNEIELLSQDAAGSA